jgi:uncharacterized membrane protein
VKPRPTTVNLVINRLTLLGIVCSLAGGYLIYAGFSQGELLVGIGISCAGNLGSILAKPSNTPDKVTIENPPDDPANVQEVVKP